jgi:peroxiredoxin Q/BCP
MPNIGSIGPAFALYNQDDEVIILDRLTSQHAMVVVYFFPQAGAPGCTREAIGFRDLMPEFTARNIRVVGITTSPAIEVREFAKANSLNFAVCSDPQRKVCEEWGALKGDNVGRMTYVVNDKGSITHYFPRVDVFKHPAELLAVLSPLFAPAAPAAPVAAPPAAAPVAAPPAAAPVAAAPPVAGTAELIVESGRAALRLLFAHKQGGGSLPSDVVELAKQIAG